MVAKSYQGLTQIGEPYIVSNRAYVKVQMKNGSQKQVRWYSDAEYRKMYPDAEVEFKPKRFKTQKEVLGFDKGYITIFKGDTYSANDYFRLSSARFNKWFGWHFVSTDEVPDDLPDCVTPVKLEWAYICAEDGVSLLNDEAVKSYVESLIYDISPSVYVGKIGERLDLCLTLDKAVELDGYYGPSTMHIFSDDKENVYVWTTTAKRLEVGDTYFISGTVKDHKTYRNTKQTILTRCKVS